MGTQGQEAVSAEQNQNAVNAAVEAAAQQASAPQAQAQPAPQQVDAPQVNASGQIVNLPSSAFKKIKDDAKERGKREALQEVASMMGYSSVEEMQSALASRSNDQAPAPASPTQSSANQPQANANAQQQPSKTMRQLMKERDRLQQELDKTKGQLGKETEKRRELAEKIEAKEAEMSLRHSALSAGVKDVDYAIHLLEKHLDGKSDADLEKFDDMAWFTGLKASHPYLFGEVTRPATTGTGAGFAPPAPTPGTATNVAAQGSKPDATKLTGDQFRELLRSKGLSLNL